MNTARHAALLALATLAGPGCAALASGDGAAPDGDVADGGIAVRGDDGGGGPPADAAAPATLDGSATAGLAEADCFDFTDDDGDGSSDCADLGCSVTPICCATGSSSPQCCVGGPAGSLEPASCVPGSPAGCGAAHTAFGARVPAIVTGITRDDACGAAPVVGLEPGGDASTDGGVFVGQPIDPAVARIRLSATLGARPGASALDAVGIGLTAQATIDGRVLPLVAVLASSSAAELRVLVGDAVVAALPFSEIPAGLACGASEIGVELVVRPEGTFTASVVAPVSGERIDLATGALPRARSARAVVFGRGEPAGPEGPAAWLSSVAVEREVCSVTAPGRDEAAVLGGGWSVAPRSVGRVTVLPAERLAAVLVDGRIYPGALDASGELVVPDPAVTNAIVRPEGAYAGGVSDPELVRDSGVLYLLFAGRPTPTGADAIFALRFLSADLGDVAGPPVLLLDAGAVNAATGALGELPPAAVATAVDSPAFFARGGSSYLLVRVHTASGTELRILERTGGLEAAGVGDSAAPASVTRAEDPLTNDYRLHANRATAPAAFDRDEVGAAQVLDLGDGVVRVLYAGRNGTRWGIGMLVSADLRHFDFAVAGGAPILTGDGTGFDAISVFDPEPIARVVGPGLAELRVWYSGSDGLRTRVGVATQSIAVIGGAP